MKQHEVVACHDCEYWRLLCEAVPGWGYACHYMLDTDQLRAPLKPRDCYHKKGTPYKRVGGGMFRQRRSIRLPYEEQGLIYFTCLSYHRQSAAMQKKIESLSKMCGGAYADALFEWVTTGESVLYISMKYFVSESVLYAIRKKFYETWNVFGLLERKNAAREKEGKGK